jgi:hypothetical protein
MTRAVQLSDKGASRTPKASSSRLMPKERARILRVQNLLARAHSTRVERLGAGSAAPQG